MYACCQLQGDGYLATPTIPVCVTNTHRSTSAEAALHDAVPANRGVRTLNSSIDTATMGVGTSNPEKPMETLNPSVQRPDSTCLQASNGHSTHSDSDQSDGHDACTAESSSQSVQFYQYHVVYLPSYSVPVLLFQAHNEGGFNLCVTLCALHYCAIAICLIVVPCLIKESYSMIPVA